MSTVKNTVVRLIAVAAIAGAFACIVPNFPTGQQTASSTPQQNTIRFDEVYTAGVGSVRVAPKHDDGTPTVYLDGPNLGNATVVDMAFHEPTIREHTWCLPIGSKVSNVTTFVRLATGIVNDVRNGSLTAHSTYGTTGQHFDHRFTDVTRSGIHCYFISRTEETLPR